MELDGLTQTAFIGACCFSMIFTTACVYQTRNQRLHWSFPVAGVVQTLWLCSIGLYETYPIFDIVTLQFTEAAHNIAWLLALMLTTKKYCNEQLPRVYQFVIYLVCLMACGLFTATLVFSFEIEIISGIICWQGMALAIFGSLGVEQLYRNVNTVRLIKLLCINLAIMFIFDAYLFSQSILVGHLSESMWQIRAAVFMATSLLMTIGTITLTQSSVLPATFHVSRPMAFYTTSLIIAGGLLTFLAISGYYVQLYGGDWGTVVYTMLVVLGLASIALIFLSRSLREKINVQINKHLFSHKYDYRKEWLKLIDRLSQPSSSVNTHELAIHVLAELFKSSGGALWMRRDAVMVPIYQVNSTLKFSECIEPVSAPFCKIMEEQDWVYSLDEDSGALAQHNEFLPAWVKNNARFWLIVPLLSETTMVAFIILNRPKSTSQLNWEDLDLLKTVGRQIANYLRLQEQSELLSEARQFDTFNRLSAYVMHDLKNLIAQQSLVVENAEKHKDNPAFVEDTIKTIHNSVNRMNNLLRKLQQSEPMEAKTLNIRDVLLEAVRGCNKAMPIPTLRSIDESIRVKADTESLVMVFTNIISNAQDATARDGYVDISVSREDAVARVLIEDNGEGMTEKFIQSRLFKPFESTKSGKGMGIGMFQAREYSQSLGGHIQVESALGEGTTFTITLPTIDQASH